MVSDAREVHGEVEIAPLGVHLDIEQAKIESAVPNAKLAEPLGDLEAKSISDRAALATQGAERRLHEHRAHATEESPAQVSTIDHPRALQNTSIKVRRDAPTLKDNETRAGPVPLVRDRRAVDRPAVASTPQD